MKATQKNDKNLTDKQKHARNIIQEESEKIRNDISQHMSLDEIKEFLLDDNSLTPEEANHLVKFTVSIPEAKFVNALPTMQEKLKEFRTVSLQGVKVSFEEQE